MVGDGILDARILAEVCRDGIELPGAVILLRLLGIDGLAVPRRSAPCVSGEGLLHAEDVIGVLGELTFSVPGFQNKLRQRYGGEDARLIHICSEKGTDRLNYITLGQSGQLLSLCAGGLDGCVVGGAKLRCDLVCQITHASIHPVARTGLVGKPAVHRQDHLVRLRRVVQGLVLVAKPDELLLAVAFADINAELDQRLVDDVPEGVGLRGIRGALDGDRPLVVGVTGGAPRAVFLLDVKTDTAITVNAIVAGGLRRGLGKPVTEAFRCTLADDAVRRDAVDGMCSLPGVIRAELGVSHHLAVSISHCYFRPFVREGARHHTLPLTTGYSSLFSDRSCSCSSTIFSFSGIGRPR